MPSDDLSRDIYLACRNLFSGVNALIRRTKAIRERIQLHRAQVDPLLKKYDLERVVAGVQRLLEKRVFELSKCARVEFPELFEQTANQQAQRVASEQQAARSEAEALAKVKTTQAKVDTIAVKEGCNSTSGDKSIVPSTAKSTRSPELFPVCLPYKSQHSILTTTQTLLERVCFDFARKWMPQLLQARSWDCPEAIELNIWTKTLAAERANIPMGAIDVRHRPLKDAVIFAVDPLRHSAVHRVPTTARGIQQMLLAAVTLATALKDIDHLVKIEKIRRELETLISDVEGNKTILETKFEKEMGAINEERAALDKREQRAIATMIKDDKEHQSSASLSLERVIKSLIDENQMTSSMDTKVGIPSDQGLCNENNLNAQDSDGNTKESVPTNKNSSTNSSCAMISYESPSCECSESISSKASDLSKEEKEVPSNKHTEIECKENIPLAAPSVTTVKASPDLEAAKNPLPEDSSSTSIVQDQKSRQSLEAKLAQGVAQSKMKTAWDSDKVYTAEELRLISESTTGPRFVFDSAPSPRHSPDSTVSPTSNDKVSVTSKPGFSFRAKMPILTVSPI